MSITKFGKITEKDGDLLVEGFTFDGVDSYRDAMLCLRDYIVEAIDTAVKSNDIETNNCTITDI